MNTKNHSESGSREAAEQFKTALLSPQNWPVVKDQVLDIMDECFPQYGGNRRINEQMITRTYMEPGVVVLLINASDETVSGFSAARVLSYDTTTANVGITAILPDYRGKRLVGELMDRLEAELKKKGVVYITRQSRINDGYADAVERHYGDRVIEKTDMPETEIDPKRSFKIRL